MADPLADSYQIVSPELTVRALRDSGYKSTAHALAELIDNSIEAKASTVEVFAVEELYETSKQTRHQVDQIAVLDDGDGMDSDTLRHALRFGAGTRQQRQGMGRFGMGLPNSSMSQCCRVDIWSWTNGPDNALHTYLDLDDIKKGMSEVPAPERHPLPEFWRDLSVALSDAGTLVVWNDLDRVQWRRAGKTLEHTEFLIGRIYRRFLTEGQVEIRLTPVREGAVEGSERYARPTDPLYLMAPSTTPAPFDDTPMFEPYLGGSGGRGVETFPITVDGVEHEVTVRVSMASDLARRPDRSDSPWPEEHKAKDPGDTPWGKHAHRNVGVSIVRADRELELDTAWVNEYDPVERWWGIEVSFPPALDEVFGVTNNKQATTIFNSLARFDWRQEADPGESYTELTARMASEGDKRLPLIELAHYIRTNALRKVRRDLKEQTRGTGSGSKKRYDEAEVKADDAVKRRRDSGHRGRSDEGSEGSTEEQAREEQRENLRSRHHFPLEDAERIIEDTFSQRRSVRLVTSRQPENPGFFNVESMIGLLQVSLNMDHEVYDQLIAALTADTANIDQAEAIDRLRRAETAFKVLLYAWARFEDEQPERGQAKARNMRWDWGRFASEFFTPPDEGDDD